MSQEEAFLVAIRAAPQDAALRLVYADWLEEGGDARAGYLRVTTNALERVRRGLSWDDLKPALRVACESAPSEWREQAGPWFDIVLESFRPDQKIPLIHLVRAITGAGLAEAKALVEAAPSVVKRYLPLEQAEAVRAGLVNGHLPGDLEPQPVERPYCRAALKESPPEDEADRPPD